MTRDELKDLACLGFSADLTMQSFCHTAAYPKPVDIDTQHTLPDFIMTRGGVSLRPGDGVFHSWLNRMLLPDTVGTGGDSHTRFPMGISFPGGFWSGRLCGSHRRDAAGYARVCAGSLQRRNAARHHPARPGSRHPYYAIQEGLLTVEKKGKKNIFSGRILEIEGSDRPESGAGFELSDASAERSAAGCTIESG